jgi:hypothetical protein
MVFFLPLGKFGQGDIGTKGTKVSEHFLWEQSLGPGQDRIPHDWGWKVKG